MGESTITVSMRLWFRVAGVVLAAKQGRRGTAGRSMYTAQFDAAFIDKTLVQIEEEELAAGLK